VPGAQYLIANQSQTELHVVILGLHGVDISFVKGSSVSVRWPETPKDLAIVQGCMVNRLYLCKLV